MGPGEVEEGERIVGLLGFFHEEKAEVALDLLAEKLAAGVAGVVDEDVGEADLMAGAVDGGENLLVDAVGPADGGVVAEQSALFDERAGSASVKQKVRPFSLSTVLIS